VGVGRVDDGGGSSAGVTRSAQLTSEVVPPAVHQRVFGQCAGVDLSGTDLHYPGEVAIVSNGRHHSTGDVVALEDLVAQTETATSVEAPAIGGPVFGHHAGVGRLGVDVDGSRQERILLVRVNYLNRAVAVGECSVTELTGCVSSPAVDRGVGGDRTRMVVTGGDLLDTDHFDLDSRLEGVSIGVFHSHRELVDAVRLEGCRGVPQHVRAHYTQARWHVRRLYLVGRRPSRDLQAGVVVVEHVDLWQLGIHVQGWGRGWRWRNRV